MEIPPIRYAAAADGLRIAYLRYPGASPPFLVLNTPGAPPLLLRSQVPALDGGTTRRFLRERGGVHFDWRGSGNSDPIEGTLSIDDLVADIEAVADAIGEPVDADFFGRSSFAGCIHAARFPHRYRSIRIFGAAVRSGESWQGVNDRPGWERNYRQHLVGVLRHYWDIPPPEAVAVAARWEASVPPESWAAYLEAERSVDLTEVLPHITVPTLVTAVNPIDYEPAAVIAALLPDSALVLSEPRLNTSGNADASRDEWDQHLGVRLGEPLSQPVSLPEAAPSLIAMTAREREVLAALVSGASNSQMAAAMTVSLRTVEYHVANIYSKLGVHSRVAAANVAREQGLL